MRQLLRAELGAEFTNDPDFHTVGEPAPRIYILGSLGALDVPANPLKPFISFRAMVSTRYQEVRETSLANRQPFQLYVYDYKGSFERIDETLRRCQSRVEAMVGKFSPSGAHCFEAAWLSVSQDFTADEYDAGARYATINLSSNH